MPDDENVSPTATRIYCAARSWWVKPRPDVLCCPMTAATCNVQHGSSSQTTDGPGLLLQGRGVVSRNTCATTRGAH